MRTRVLLLYSYRNGERYIKVYIFILLDVLVYNVALYFYCSVVIEKYKERIKKYKKMYTKRSHKLFIIRLP